MKFKMNDREWIIKEVPQSNFWKDSGELDKMNDEECYFGRTKYKLQEIWIDEDLPIDLKKKTLYHELMHCYKGSYICFYDLNGQDEDFWCELSSNSHDIIHKIVEDYFTTNNVVLESPTNIAGRRIIKEVKKREQC